MVRNRGLNRRLLAALLALALLLAFQGSALAQVYFFSLDRMVVDVYLNEDGSVDVDYVFTLNNQPSADPMEFVDVGMPNGTYRLGNITAEVDGQPITIIEDSPYVSPGVAVGLGANAIPPGQTGRVRVFVPGLSNLYFTDETDANYTSVQFVNSWFDSDLVTGSTDLTMTFHLPPGVQPEESRWQAAPAGFPEEPEGGFDDQGRITYTWRNTNARPDRGYTFGASVPRQYVAAGAIRTPPQPSAAERLGIDPDLIIGTLVCGGFIAFFSFLVGISVYADRRRKMQYLPPKISIGGHGIKRGLTAVEAAILLEQPMDKVMTMILFAVLKKGAARVVSRDPLDLEIDEPIPEDLRTYETHFLQAFLEKEKRARRRLLQDMMIKLVKSVAKKMKGFSKRETVNYYRDIMQRAWAQVEAADTPEVKSQKFDEVMEWTMLDRDFDDRTRDVFRTGPVIIPTWWHRYDPGFGRAGSGGAARTSVPSAGGGGSGGGISMPNLPGSAFAASVVNGVQDFSAGVVGNVSDFTSGITKQTNPPPPPSSSSGRSGGGSSCACACAGCACACACAGGGR